MSNKKYIMLDLNDPKIASLADVMSNPTAKKIIEYLSEKEASENEITKDLNLKANTVNYNISKLMESGLIEKSTKWNWSVKGKKIPYYRVANKKIIITPKSFNTGKQFILSLASIGAIALVLKKFYSNSVNTLIEASGSSSAAGIAEVDYAKVAPSVDVARDSFYQVPNVINSMPDPHIWAWFLLGGITALIVFMVLNNIDWKEV